PNSPIASAPSTPSPPASSALSSLPSLRALRACFLAPFPPRPEDSASQFRPAAPPTPSPAKAAHAKPTSLQTKKSSSLQAFAVDFDSRFPGFRVLTLKASTIERKTSRGDSESSRTNSNLKRGETK